MFSRDPAATVGPIPTINEIADLTAPANTTELATTSTEGSPLAESTSTNIALQRVRSINCDKTSDKSPLLVDVFDVWDSLKDKDDNCPLKKVTGGCKSIAQKGKAVILACPDKNNPPSWTCKDVAALVESYARNCYGLFGYNLKVSGNIPYSGASYVKIQSTG